MSYPQKERNLKMTLNDLKEEICALGFEKDIAIDKNLLFAIRRALSTVYTERGILSSFFIEHRLSRPTLIFDNLTHTEKSSESFLLSGKAYSFTVSGTGSFIVEENGVRKEYSFSSPLYLWRGFINGDATLTFFGEFTFEVFNLAVFKTVRSDKEDELFAYGEPFEYNLGTLRDDFYCIASAPTDENDMAIEGAMVRGNRLIVPWGYNGRIKITYKIKPPRISAESPSEEIEISEESRHLVALLASAYYWIDDAPEKAEFYLAMYKDTLKSVKEYDTRLIGSGYGNVTGWI